MRELVQFHLGRRPERFVLILAAGLLLSACGAERNIQIHSAEIRKLGDMEGSVPVREISARYDRYLARYSTSESAVHLSTPALRNLFGATFTTAFTGANPDHALALGTIAAEMARHGQLQPQDVRDLQGVYILVRDFESARRLASGYPDFELESIPAVTGKVDKSAANSLELISDGSELQISGFAQTPGPRIVIMSSLGCGPSIRALSDIKHDAAIAILFKKYATWVMPPQSTLDVERMTKWNAENPGFRFRHAYSPQGWQGIDTWNETPIFYFIRDGQQKSKVIGWPKGGRWDELKAGLKAIDLM